VQVSPNRGMLSPPYTFQTGGPNTPTQPPPHGLLISEPSVAKPLEGTDYGREAVRPDRRASPTAVGRRPCASGHKVYRILQR
jgi:hypothetical protein